MIKCGCLPARLTQIRDQMCVINLVLIQSQQFSSIGKANCFGKPKVPWKCREILEKVCRSMKHDCEGTFTISRLIQPSKCRPKFMLLFCESGGCAISFLFLLSRALCILKISTRCCCPLGIPLLFCSSQINSVASTGVLYYGDTFAGGKKASEHVVELKCEKDLEEFVTSQDESNLVIVDISLSTAQPCIRVFPAVLALARSFTVLSNPYVHK